jgi:hypothetical protein
MTPENKLKTIEWIRRKFGGCFGTADGIFAGHSADETRAKEIRSLAAGNGVTLKEMEEIAMDYLAKKGCHEDHIREQMADIHSFFSKKIS